LAPCGNRRREERAPGPLSPAFRAWLPACPSQRLVKAPFKLFRGDAPHTIGRVKDVAQLLNAMRDAGIIRDYALFGAVAQMRYTEPVATLDADVLVVMPAPDRLDVLTPIYEFCAGQGYRATGEAIQVGAWPVQFIPVFSALTREAVEQAETADFEGIPFRVVRADYLAVIALSVGRSKDFARILALIEAGSVTRETVARLAAQHGLADPWRQFEARFFGE
jgi:hypothetical protein